MFAKRCGEGEEEEDNRVQVPRAGGRAGAAWRSKQPPQSGGLAVSSTPTGEGLWRTR